MLKQRWECEECGKKGSVNFREDEHVLEVAIKIGFDHNEISPDCNNSAEELVLSDLQEDNTFNNVSLN